MDETVKYMLRAVEKAMRDLRIQGILMVGSGQVEVIDHPPNLGSILSLSKVQRR